MEIVIIFSNEAIKKGERFNWQLVTMESDNPGKVMPILTSTYSAIGFLCIFKDLSNV